jgi:hypothetical protein
MTSRRHFLRQCGLGAAFLTTPALLHAAAEPVDSASPPLEETPTDAKLAKIVLVAGPPSHAAGEHEFFAGCYVLHKLLAQTPGVFPVLVRDGWPKNPKTFENAKAVVFFLDGGGEQAYLKGDRPTEVQKLAEAGVGFVHLHTAIDYPKDFGDRARSWLGGCYEPGFSKRAHWIADFAALPEHPICRGVKPFKVNDGWLYNLRFAAGLKGVTPLLRTPDPKAKLSKDEKPGDDAIVSWAYDRLDGSRAFVFTGAHLHSSWGDESYRRYLVNGVLWAAKVEVPAAGAPVELDPAELKKHLDPKPPAKAK